MSAVSKSSSSPSVLTRHQGRLWINLASRCARLQFSGLPVDVKVKVRLIWMYCYDPDSLHPDWKELRGASGETEVGQGNTADFSLVFGPSTPGDSDHKPKHVCAMVLTRPDPGIVAASPPNAPILPTLSYVLQVVEGGAEGYRTNGRLALKALWGETVFTEAIEYFNKFAGGPTEEFLDTRSIGRILEGVWDSLFMYLRQGEHAREKRRGKRTEEDGDDACVDDDQPVIEVPKLSPEIIERIILIATESETAPAMISRRAFCGKSPTEGISIWRVFQNVLELVGRSLFIRQLFNARQLYLLGAQETKEIFPNNNNSSTLYRLVSVIEAIETLVRLGSIHSSTLPDNLT